MSFDEGFGGAEEILCIASMLSCAPREDVRPVRKPIRFNWIGTPTPDEISAAQVVNYESEIA